MFKSSFMKYLTAVVIIIFVSFFMLSGIITSMIRTQVLSDKRNKLEMSASIIAQRFESSGVENLENYIAIPEGSSSVALIPIVNFDYDFNILITDPSGKVLLSTVEKDADNNPSILGELGVVDKDLFEPQVLDSGEYLVYTGELAGIIEDSSMVYGKRIYTNGELVGYVFSLASTENDDRLITTTRRTVFNSSIWVMLAAVIAVYFITERIVHPLKNITRVTKKFGKGDFTERVEVYGNDEVAELGRAFNNMADSLDNLEKMRNSFLANVSHDLRTPMTTISGFIDGINSGAIPKEQHEHYLNVISQEVHRLSRLVSQLLDVSRLESGDRKFVFDNFDIAEVARLIIISLGQKIDEKMLDVEFDAEYDQMIAYADKDAIHQVLYNLCENAIKFSKQSGRLSISVKYASSKKITVRVYDEGQVLTEEDKNRVFDRFYKTDKSRGLDKNGVGLGLYISKTIIEAHDEKIDVESLEDGCAFSFTLKCGTPKLKPAVYADEQ